MDFSHLFIFTVEEQKRTALGARNFKIILNKFGIGAAYRKPTNIGVFRDFLYERGQFAVPSGGVKLLIKNVAKHKESETHVGGAVHRVLPGNPESKFIGTFWIETRTGDISYVLESQESEKVGDSVIDYHDVCQSAIDLFESQRRISAAEIYSACEKLIGIDGLHIGPMWLITNDIDPEAVAKMRELSAICHEWRYKVYWLGLKLESENDTINEIAAEEILRQIVRRAQKGQRVFRARYRKFPEVLSLLVDRGHIRIIGQRDEIKLITKTDNS